jgi:hypothetical protein
MPNKEFAFKKSCKFVPNHKEVFLQHTLWKNSYNGTENIYQFISLEGKRETPSVSH